MVYTVKQLAEMAGVSVRTLHYYDQVGLFAPRSHDRNGYRQYGEEEAVLLQQIMFFREMGFSLQEIRDIVHRPDFDVINALQSHRTLLIKKEQRIQELLGTIDRTIHSLKGGSEMKIKDYYQGFSDEQVEEMRAEVRERYGEDALRQSEARVSKLSKSEFARLQAEGSDIWKKVAEKMAEGAKSPKVQQQIDKWRLWLTNFYDYNDEMLLGPRKMYSSDERFAANFLKYGKGMPEFVTKAIEYYVKQRKAGKK